MRLIDIECDEEKNEINKRVHNIGFEQAQYFFSDPERLERLDESEGNSSGEERWQTLGMVGKVLFVVYTYRREKKRIISARVADKDDRRSYHGYYYIDGKGWAKAT